MPSCTRDTPITRPLAFGSCSTPGPPGSHDCRCPCRPSPQLLPITFIVSRRDLNGDRIWIVSGQVYGYDAAGIYQSRMTGNWPRRMLIGYLSLRFPAFECGAYQQMVWGVYPARLTTLRRQAGTLPDDLATRTFTDMGIEGLLVCYTDRLTITPLAAEEIERRSAPTCGSAGR